MKFSIVFPTTEIGNDPIVIRDWTQAVEAMGYEHILFSDHVTGPNPATYPNIRGNTSKTPYHEPFVTMGYLAGFTNRVKLATGVLVAPQRQTALIAKQAAEVDVLTQGRLVLGVGVGNRAMEYEAQNEDLHTRGRRLDEQIEVIRLLWSGEPVVFHGKWHHLSDVAINPAPVQRPIPIWIGGSADRVLDRAGRLGDGWIPSSGSLTREQIDRVHAAARSAGREPSAITIAPRIMEPLAGGEDYWRETVSNWKNVGAHVIFLNTRDCGLTTPDAHLDLTRRFIEAVRDLA